MICIFSRRCLPYASVLQIGIFFRKLTGSLFLYCGTKGPSGSVIKHTFATPRIRSFRTLYARQTIINCLLRHFSPDSVLFTTVLIFHQEKNWLSWKCVINYEVRSANFWDLTQRRMAILTTIVLLDP